MGICKRAQSLRDGISEAIKKVDESREELEYRVDFCRVSNAVNVEYPQINLMSFHVVVSCFYL